MYVDDEYSEYSSLGLKCLSIRTGNIEPNFLLMFQGNRRSAGFTDEERNSFQTNFLDRGFVDTFRKQHPDVVGYTYWGFRHGGRRTNKGVFQVFHVMMPSVFSIQFS